MIALEWAGAFLGLTLLALFVGRCIWQGMRGPEDEWRAGAMSDNRPEVSPLLNALNGYKTKLAALVLIAGTALMGVNHALHLYPPVVDAMVLGVGNSLGLIGLGHKAEKVTQAVNDALQLWREVRALIRDVAAPPGPDMPVSAMNAAKSPEGPAQPIRPAT